jgi:hypothetical protein
MVAGYKHSSLLGPFVSYEENEALIIWPLMSEEMYHGRGPLRRFDDILQGILIEGEGSVQLTSLY